MSEFKKMKIEEIKLGDNPRKNMGDITELINSIKEQGILNPLSVNENKVLLAGGRRLEAAKAAGLTEVPVIIHKTADEEQDAEISLIENIHREDLSPVEEGEAFKKYIDETKHDSEYLALKIGKSKKYIDNRLLMAELSPEIKSALQKGKIKPGHAIIISRADKADQAKLLTKAKKTNVTAFAEELYYDSDEVELNLENAPFSTKACKNCQKNGGEQSILTEIGSELKGVCLSKSCYIAKCKEELEHRIKAFEAKGIKLMSEAEINKIVKKEKIASWKDEYEKIKKKLPNSNDFVMVVYLNDSLDINEDIYCINPKAEKDLKTGQNKVKNDPETEANEEMEKERETKDRLKLKVSGYKREFLLKLLETKATKHAMSALVLYALIDGSRMHRSPDFAEALEPIKKELKCNNYDLPKLDKLMEFSDIDLNQHIIEISKIWLRVMSEENVVTAATDAKITWDKDFKLDEGFLNLHTKDQLLKLVKELKIKDIEGNLTKPDLVKEILNKSATSKVVPKILGSKLSI